MKLLLTGASGLLGGNCFAQLTRYAHVQCFATYHDSSFTIPQTFSNGHDAFTLDLTDETSVWNIISTLQPNTIIHTAAHTETAFCEWNRKDAYALNVRATKTLATLAETFGARFIFISTDLVFDGTKGNYDEDDTPNPMSYYAETKLEAELLVKNLVGNYVILRSPLLMGVSPRGTRSVNERLLREFQAGKQVKLFVDEFRTPIFADVLARIIAEFAVGTLSETTGLFHAGGAERLSREALGRKIAAHGHINPNLIEGVSSDDVPSAVPRPKDVSLNSTNLYARLPFSVPTIEESLNALP
ncbi:MAG: SDR family oxidoreductase [Chloroherpetonaceae bacterium]